MIRLLTISFLFLPILSCAAFGGTFVGNGGDGIEIDGKLYLRDLVNLSLHKTPYFGAHIDSELPALPDPTVMSLEYSKKLLAQKLTDLNEACPSMGDYLLATIKYYNWVLVDFPLTPITDPRDTIELPPGTKVVQIANRLGNTIRIQADAWNRLNDENKIALIIHEAIFSLTKLTKVPFGMFEQSPYTAREITGQLFSPSFLLKPASIIFDALKGSLNIPASLQSTNAVRQAPKWVWFYGLVDSNKKIASHEIDLKKVDIDSLSGFVNRSCAEVNKLNKNSRYVVQSSWHSRPVKLEAGQYSVAGDNKRFQTYLSIELQSTDRSIAYDFGSMEECQLTFSAQLEDLISDLSW